MLQSANQLNRRLQIRLSEDMAVQLKQLSRKTNVDISVLVREALKKQYNLGEN